MGLMDLMFESKKPTSGKVVPASQAATSTAVARDYSPSVAASSAPNTDDSNKAYARLLEATSFEQTPVGKILQKYLEPLAAVPMDPVIKMKSAIAQAIAIDKIVPEQINQTFDTLIGNLEAETAGFEEWKTKKAERIAGLAKDIERLQKEIADASVELSTQQTKLSSGEAQFQAAYARRTQEIKNQAMQFKAYL